MWMEITMLSHRGHIAQHSAKWQSSSFSLRLKESKNKAISVFVLSLPYTRLNEGVEKEE